MRKQTVEYYEWIDDVGPVLLANLNELLVAKGVEPVRELHGGKFKDGKWVDILDGDDYRNYWHAYIHLWGKDISNDSFQKAYFPDPGDDDGWQHCTDDLREWVTKYKTTADPTWTDDLVSAMRNVVKDHFLLDEHGDYCKVVFWWCW